MDVDKIEEFLKSEGEPSFRLKQIKQAVFLNFIKNWNETTNLSPKLREKLNTNFPILTLEEQNLLTSKDENTVKVSFKTNDGYLIESVLMRHQDRNTVCVSSQAGCPIKCAFCATGQNGFNRNLTTDEILEQVLFFSRYLNASPNNIVFMGMGEPLLNYDNVLSAVNILNKEMGIGARKISISTAGIVEGIEKLTKEPLQINLAISLHAPTNELRSELIPINKKYNLESVLKAVDNYIKSTNRKVMFEYLMIDGINDTEKHARQLTLLLKNLRRSNFVVNLVNLNTIDESKFRPSKQENILMFKEILEKTRMSVTERYRFGKEIDAACGQLAGKH